MEVAVLSGGQAARAALAAILLSRFDVLLLDEPTNNLDFAGLDRLEQFVHEASGAVVVVSHDRAFLDESVDRMLELQEESRRAVEYAGSWSDYVAARDLARSQQYARYGEFTAKRSALLERSRTQKAWSEQGKRNVKKSGRTGQEHPPREDRAEREAGGEGEDHRAGDAAARDGGEAVGGLGAPDAARAVGPQRRRGGPPRSGGGGAGHVPARSDRPRDRLAGAHRDPRPERERQDHAAARAARRDPAHVGAALDRPRACRSARWTSPARSCPRTSR